MDRNIKKILNFGYILTCTSMMFSCQADFLDTVPKDSLTEETVWTDPQGATQFINGIYGGLQSGFDRNYDGWAKGLYLLDGCSDDGDVTMGWTHSTLFQNADFTPSYAPWSQTWGDIYGLIRKANAVIENVDRLGDESLRNRLKGEAYFLRAFNHHELLKLYGYNSNGSDPTGIPIIDRTLKLGDNLQIPRSSYDDVVDFIVSDLEMAQSLLPKVGQIEAGRATSGAALALKSRVLLYAARPDRSDRYVQAALAAKELIDLHDYSLFSDYRTLFLTKNNQEIIFAKKFQAPDRIHLWENAGWDVINSPRVFRGPSDAGWNGTVPTQNFVESYEMTDGKSQADSPNFDPENPYENLDPRFEATVVHNGSTFRGLQLFFCQGCSGDAGPGENGLTGYSLRKFHEEQFPIYTHSSDQDWIFIRYAEVLLNYAEAQNEAEGPDQSVHDAINEIRSRTGVNMPNLPTGLTKEEMRERIRNERRIELAFEEHRFFDIRRWGIAEDLLNGPIYGMKIEEDGGNYIYTREAFETRVFLPKLYVLPIPQGEIDKNPAAKQILGW